MELTEELAATLRQLRLNHPVNGEILTAENLSKAIGNNRAWMSQIESRRLKKIKREDVIKIYKLLYNEKDDAKAERLAEMDLYVYENSYQNDICTIDKVMNDLRKLFTQKYLNCSCETEQVTLLHCLDRMLNNFKQDYEHTRKIYSITIGYDDIYKCSNDKINQQYNDSFNDIWVNYNLSVNELLKRTNRSIFLMCSSEICEKLFTEIDSITPTSTFSEISAIILKIMNYNQSFFECIKTPNSYSEIEFGDINFNALFNKLMEILNSISNKLKIEFNLSFELPNKYTNVDALSKTELEIDNFLLDLIQHMTYK